jgi:tetraacyldisaccharide 4'-kinase
MKRIDAYWYSVNPVACVLLPVSLVYCGISLVRSWLYRAGLFKSVTLPVPVIIIGNIAVGGTGKTPLLIALCELLKSNDIKAGIVSRGYKGEFSGEKLVNENDTSLEVGDEPFIIARRTKCPVSVGKNRVAAAQLLLKKYQCDVILSDDGLQHYKMRRNYEIAVIDAARQHGNGFCLPAGPLREPVFRLQSVNLVVYNGVTDQSCKFALVQSSAVNLLTGDRKEVSEFTGNKVHAIAGIGNPVRFFEQLRSAGMDIIEHEFLDHHIYTEDDLRFNDDRAIFMTEKDAVKCDFYSKNNAWYVPVSAELSGSLVAKFVTDVKRIINA